MPDEITLSRETLRAELAQLELRLVDRLSAALDGKADHAIVEQQELRIRTLEESRASRETLPQDLAQLETRLGRLERWRYAVPGSAAIAALAAAATAFITFIQHIH